MSRLLNLFVYRCLPVFLMTSFIASTTVLNASESESADVNYSENFKKGNELFESGRYSEALLLLEQIPLDDWSFGPYAGWVRGQALIKLERYKDAASVLEKVRKSKVSRALIYKATFDLGIANFKLERYRKARQLFRSIERKTRWYDLYPELLYHLTWLELNYKNRWRACKYARKLFSRFPDREISKGWSMDLSSNKVFEKPTTCQANFSTKQKRLRNLQLSGLDTQAKSELEQLIELRSSELEKVYAKVDYLVQEGDPYQGLQLMLAVLEKGKNSRDYLKRVAKVAARSEEVSLATYFYNQIYKKWPRNRHGREALFNAGILNYQYQNYDVANALLTEYSNKFWRFRTGKTALWYAAWTDYLRGNNVESAKNIEKLLKRYRRKPWQNSRWERLRFWLAMNYLVDDGKKDRGIKILQDLAKNQLFTYYQMLSEEKLNQMGESVDGSQGSSLIALNDENAFMAQDVESDDEEPTADAEETDEEAESDDSSTDEKTLVADDESTDVDIQDFATNFKDPRLQKRFERAKALHIGGFDEYATWELREIERRTSNREYLERLIDFYRESGNYRRAAYISQIYFGLKRERKGIEGVRYLWTAAYPQAYDAEVSKASERFEIPKNQVWAFMRAESFFDPGARSPVGAMGLMQMMPYTANRLRNFLPGSDPAFKPTDLFTPEVSIKFGTRYLARLNAQFDADLPFVAAGYNAGPHRVKGWLGTFGDLSVAEFIEHIPYKETRNYVKKVVRNHSIYGKLYGSSKNSEVSFHRSARVQWQKATPFQEEWEKVYYKE
jgi:soluble lytic murein transglycosylase